MQSPAAAIGWELWGRNRRGIVAAGAALAGAAVLAALLPAATAEDGVIVLSTVWLAVACLYLLAVVTHCEFHEGRVRLGLPARMFTLPVRTGALVAWLMFYGLAALALLWLATGALVWLPAGVEPAWWVLPLLAVALVWFQAVCWAVPGPPVTKVVAACVIFPALKFVLELIATAVVLFVNHESRVDQQALARARPVVLTVFAAGFIPLAYVFAVIGVARARRGAGAGGWWLRRAAGRALARPPRRERPLRSPFAAQLWFEWRRKGLVLPLFLVCFLLFFAAVTAPFVGPGAIVRVVLLTAGLTVAVAYFVGYGFGKTSFWASDLRLPAFQATRPVGSGELAGAKLAAAGLSALAATAVVVLGVPLGLGLLGRADEVARWLGPPLQGLGGPPACALVLLGAAGLFTLTWGQLVGGLVPSLTGRAWVVNGVVAAYLTVAVGLGLLTRYVLHHPDALGPTVTALAWACGALVGVKLVVAAGVLRASHRRGLLSPRAAVVTAAAWTAGAACLLIAADRFLPEQGQPLAVAAVLLVPLVRPLAAPLAVAWNRHR